MKISAELETKLDALRLEGLMRYAAMKSAERAYQDMQKDNPEKWYISDKIAEILEQRDQAKLAYRRIAADFLRISGKEKEADTVEKFLETSCRKDFLDRIDRINAQFLGLSVE